jgi:hypothetical protein
MTAPADSSHPAPADALDPQSPEARLWVALVVLEQSVWRHMPHTPTGGQGRSQAWERAAAALLHAQVRVGASAAEHLHLPAPDAHDVDPVALVQAAEDALTRVESQPSAAWDGDAGRIVRDALDATHRAVGS